MEKTIQENIKEIVAECSTPGWDGSTATPISSEIEEKALEFVKVLPKALPPPSVIATADGFLELEWPLSKASLKLIFDGTKKVKYFASMGSKSSVGVLPSASAFSNLVSAAVKIKGFRNKK